MKKVFLGLFAAVVAVSGSAFTLLPPSGTVYGSLPGTATAYTQRVNPYDSSNCDQSSKKCAYFVTSAGASQNLPTTLTAAQITNAVAQGWLVPSTENGIYIGD